MEYSFFAAADPQPDGSCLMFYWIRVPDRPFYLRLFRPCEKSGHHSRGTYVFLRSTGTYGAKTEYHGDNTLLGISSEQREFQDREKSIVPSRHDPTRGFRCSRRFLLLSPPATYIPAHSVRARNRVIRVGEHVFSYEALALTVRLSPQSPPSPTQYSPASLKP